MGCDSSTEVSYPGQPHGYPNGSYNAPNYGGGNYPGQYGGGVGYNAPPYGAPYAQPYGGGTYGGPQYGDPYAQPYGGGMPYNDQQYGINQYPNVPVDGVNFQQGGSIHHSAHSGEEEDHHDEEH